MKKLLSVFMVSLGVLWVWLWPVAGASPHWEKAVDKAGLNPNTSLLYSHFETPKLSLISASRPPLVINELMPSPDAVLDVAGEWVELYNPNDTAVDINGCRLKDDGSDDHLIDNGGPLIIAPGGYLLLGKNGDPAQNGGVTLDYVYGQFGYFLNDVADEIVLACDGLELDRVNYDDVAGFPNVSGASWQLAAPTLENTVGANWCEAVGLWPGSLGDRGTPGAINACPTDLAIQMTVTPETVSAGQPLTYTLVYTNFGPGVTNALITNLIPLSLTNVGYVSSGPAITSVVSLTYTWQVFDFLPNTTGIITVTGQIQGPVLSNTTLLNTAQITAAFDNNAANNQVTVAVEVTSSPLLTTLYLPLIIKGEVAPPALPPDLVITSLVASSKALTVVIQNIGGSAVVDAFWVDVYLNPTASPTTVNQQWSNLGSQGLVWGVVAPALPIAPAQQITLTLNDASYRPDFSNFSLPLTARTPVYAQVDAVNLLTTYGGVLESHEVTGGVYNNITQTLSVSGSPVLEPPVSPNILLTQANDLPVR